MVPLCWMIGSRLRRDASSSGRREECGSIGKTFRFFWFLPQDWTQLLPSLHFSGQKKVVIDHSCKETSLVLMSTARVLRQKGCQYVRIGVMARWDMVCCLKLLKGPCLTGLVIKHWTKRLCTHYTHPGEIGYVLSCGWLYMDVRLRFNNFVYTFSGVNVMLFHTDGQSFP